MGTINDIRARFEVGIKKMEEKEVPVKIDNDVVGTIDVKDTQTIETIKTTVNSAGSRDSIIDFLKEIGFPENEANNLFLILAKSSDMSKTSEYLLSRNITLGSLLNKVSDAKVINTNIGMSGKPGDMFYGFTWRTSPPMGPGEPWLSTVLSGGRRPKGSEKGDVIVDDLELEVKGPNGRLIGQSGYGDAKQIRTSFARAIENIAKELKLTNFNIIKDDRNDAFWNVTKKEGRGLELNLKAIAGQIGLLDKKAIQLVSSEIINAFKTYLLNLNVKKYSSILTDCILQDGTINTVKWHSAILTMYFEYYHSIEGFDYIALTTSTGKFAIIDVSKFKEFYDRGLINATSAPSFTNSAGSQGGTYGITLK